MKQLIHTQYIASIVCFLMLVFVSSHAMAVDINSASAKEIAAELNMVGMKKAQDIINYRKTHGMFKSSRDLLKVPGIGEKIVEENRGKIKYKRASKHANKATDSMKPTQ